MYRFWIVVGCFLLLVGAFGFDSAQQATRSMGLGQVGLGLGFVIGGIAELLPKDKTKAATLLRFVSLTLFVLSIGVFVASMWMMLT